MYGVCSVQSMDLELRFESQMQPHPQVSSRSIPNFSNLGELKAMTETNQPINNQDKAENLSSFVSVISHEHHSKIEETGASLVFLLIAGLQIP